MASAGRFIWWDLMTVDIEKSAVFFAQLLGFDLLQPEDDEGYLMLAPPGTEEPVFGFVPINAGEGVQSHWMGYLAVADLDEALDKASEAGAVVNLGPEEDAAEAAELEVQFGIITDPQGAVLGLMSDPGTLPDTGDELRGVGAVAWVELLAGDRAKAGEFYRDVFGWEVGPEHERGEEGQAHAIFHHERVFGLVRDLPKGSPVPPHWAYFLRVDNLDEAIARARELGGFMYEDPAPVDGGRRVMMLDPTGAPVALWQVG
ncbi:MAG: VOC family protein [Myxococcota bacterium]